MKNKIGVTVDAKLPFVTTVLSVRGISLYEVRQQGSTCFFYINKKDFLAVKKFFMEKGKEIKVVKVEIFSLAVKKLLTRNGLFFGLVIATILFSFYFSQAREIVVTGNELVPTETIESAVNDCITIPAPKSDIDVDVLKTRVCLLPGVSDASVKVMGNTIIVDVLEELPQVENKNGPVTSQFDAVVTKIVVYKGECQCQVGQAVKKGQILIGGGDNPAQGEVYGRAWLIDQIVVTPKRVVMKRTGRQKTVYSISDKNVRCKEFELYEKETRDVLLPLVFPVKGKMITFYEMEEIEEEVDFEKEKDEIIATRFSALENRIPEGAEKVDQWFFVKTVDKMVVLDLYYEVVVKISE